MILRITYVLRFSYTSDMNGAGVSFSFNTLGELKSFLGQHLGNRYSPFYMKIIKYTDTLDVETHTFSTTSEEITSW